MRRTLWVLVAAVLVLPAACANGTSGLPPPPATPRQDLGPSEPPVVWIGGTLVRVAADRIRLREPAGSLVELRRLAGSATKFFRVAGDRWESNSGSEVRPGDRVCAETLMNGSTLLALRVFLGADCGPT